MIIDELVLDRLQEDVDRIIYLASLVWDGMTADEQDEWINGINDLQDADGNRLYDADNELLMAAGSGDIKGAYNAADLNRVGEAVDYIATILNAYGYSVSVVAKQDWVTSDIPNKAQMVEYLHDIETLRSVLTVPSSTPETPYTYRNLLDNPQFKLNRRGLTNYSGAGMTVDGWMLAENDASVSVNPNGISCSLISTGQLIQYCPLSFWQEIGGKTVTLSVLLQDGTFGSATITLPSSMATHWDTPNASVGGVYFDIVGRPDTGHCGARVFSITPNSSFSVQAVKMELGNTQTLAKYENGIWVIDTDKNPTNGLTFSEANDIEKILYDVYNLILKMQTAWFYSGEIYSGEV